jgi:hypothetical protein
VPTLRGRGSNAHESPISSGGNTPRGSAAGATSCGGRAICASGDTEGMSEFQLTETCDDVAQPSAAPRRETLEITAVEGHSA